MSTQKTTQQDVESWELSDELWEKIEPLLPRPKSRLRGRGRQRRDVGGRPAADRRTVMAGILYLMRTGSHWNAAPKEYGSGKTLHLSATGRSLFPEVGTCWCLQEAVESRTAGI